MATCIRIILWVCSVCVNALDNPFEALTVIVDAVFDFEPRTRPS